MYLLKNLIIIIIFIIMKSNAHNVEFPIELKNKEDGQANRFKER